MIKFSNPRLYAAFSDWPLGGTRRGHCAFSVETDPKKGQRVSRITTGKPKYTTYGDRMCVVDGDNGRTYILQEKTTYGHSIRVIMHDLMYDATADLKTPNHSSYFSKEPITSDPDWAVEERLIFTQLLLLLDAAK